MKTSFLTGEWTDQNFWNSVYPVVRNSNLATLISKRLSVHETKALFDRQYDVVFMDDKILYFDDNVFLDYLKTIVQLSKKICLFELPFDLTIDLKTIYKRTKQAFEFIKDSDDSICLISPAIVNKTKNLDYFFDNYKFFDAYSVHFYNEHNTTNIVSISSNLSKIFTHYKKKIYVTKYASPCYDKTIINTFLNESWKPCNSFDAAVNWKNFYLTLNKISNNIDFFYCGTYNDVYSPILNERKNFIEACENNKWEPIHFCGLCDYEGNIKEPLLNSIVNHV